MKRAILMMTLLASQPLMLANTAWAFSMEDVGKAAAGLIEEQSPDVLPSQTNALIETLSSQLGISRTQAIGGAGALLRLAGNKLPADLTRLQGAVPGLEMLTKNESLTDMAGLLGQISGNTTNDGSIGAPTSLADVNTAFSNLGISDSATSQFAPALLNYLEQQGVALSLLNSLSDLWGVAF